MTVENSKGECNLGQHEINFLYGPALRTADDHAIYKNGAKEIAAQEGHSITFIAKWDSEEGNSCHIHCSLGNEGGGNAFGDDRQMFDRFVAGQLAALRGADALLRAAHQLVQALRRGLVRADRGRVGRRQPHLRDARRRPRPVAPRREPPAGRRRQPVPRAGVDDRGRPRRHRLASSSSSRRSRATRTPPTSSACRRTSTTRATSSPQSDLAREAFGQEVVDHYLNHAQVELDAFEAAVTDWEKFRGFERL